jgi:hypothetical protein
MLLLFKIQDYMERASRGEVSIPPEAVTDFANSCRDSVITQLNKQREYKIRMSGLGRPICQQLLEKKGIEQEIQYNMLFRFLFGDLVESIAVLVLEQAGVEIVDKQKQVSLNIGGTEVSGTLDLILRDESGQDKVWDVKSASEWAFKFKYTGFGGYDKIKEDDPFGYVMQGHLYGEATGLPFGGWIVVNKSSGEVAIVEAPEWQEDDRKEYLKDAEKRVKELTDESLEFKIPFKDIFETYKQDGQEVRTGNKLLPKPCTMCGFKAHCWKDAVLHDRITSKAKQPPQAWYSKLKKKAL